MKEIFTTFFKLILRLIRLILWGAFKLTELVFGAIAGVLEEKR